MPELRPFIGQTVEFEIESAVESTIILGSPAPGSPEWEKIMAAAQNLDEYDDQALVDQDACDIRDAQERMK